jgi:hypothetical protein
MECICSHAEWDRQWQVAGQIKTSGEWKERAVATARDILQTHARLARGQTEALKTNEDTEHG